MKCGIRCQNLTPPNGDAENFYLWLISADPVIAARALESGVDRIVIDLEIIGKNERQGHLDTVISNHCIADISQLRPSVPAGSLMVRTNPIHSGSQKEIDAVIDGGADIVMLPMFYGPREVEVFCEMVRGRAVVCLLFETVGSLANLEKCIQIEGVREVHIGLNDLHIEMGCKFMFEVMVSEGVRSAVEILKNYGIPFGIGGIARIGEGLVPAENVLLEHAFLGSQGAILSRTFFRGSSEGGSTNIDDLTREVSKIRGLYSEYLRYQCSQLHDGHNLFLDKLEAIVKAT